MSPPYWRNLFLTPLRSLTTALLLFSHWLKLFNELSLTNSLLSSQIITCWTDINRGSDLTTQRQCSFQSARHFTLLEQPPSPLSSYSLTSLWSSTMLISLQHQILLSSLAAVGIRGMALVWYTISLTSCSFQVAWGGAFLTSRSISTWVSRRSILGPLFFSLYTRSLGPVISALR